MLKLEAQRMEGLKMEMTFEVAHQIFLNLIFLLFLNYFCKSMLFQGSKQPLGPLFKEKTYFWDHTFNTTMRICLLKGLFKMD